MSADRSSRLLIVGATCLVLGACATIANRANFRDGEAAQLIAVTSEPAGARVLVAGTQVGVTPGRIVIRSREKRAVLRFAKDGYDAADVSLKRTVSGWVAGDVALALIAANPLMGLGDSGPGPPSRSTRVGIAVTLPAVALGIDLLSGAAFKLPSSVRVRLKPRVAALTPPVAPAQFKDVDLRSALISITRENHCGFGQPDPTDIHQCPSYSVATSGDGTVTYEGRSGVRTLGKRTHKIAIEGFRKLIAEFEQANFFSLQDRYDSIVLGNGMIQSTDHAIATTISVSIGGKTKSVYDFYGTPDAVKRLGRRVDEVADSRRYTGRPPDNAPEPTARTWR